MQVIKIINAPSPALHLFGFAGTAQNSRWHLGDI
jgi:hypothetical protein